MNGVNKDSLPLSDVFISVINSSLVQNKNFIISNMTKSDLVGPKITHEVKVRTTDTLICALIDDGSGVNLCHPRVVTSHKLKTLKHDIPIQISGYGGMPSTPELIVQVPIKVGNEDIDLYAFVSDSPLLARYDLVIGTPILGRKLGFLIRPKELPALLVPKSNSSGVEEVVCKTCVSKYPDFGNLAHVNAIFPHASQVNDPMEICGCDSEPSKYGPSTPEKESATCCSSCAAILSFKDGEGVGPTLSKPTVTERAPTLNEKTHRLDVPSDQSTLIAVRSVKNGRKKRRLLEKASIKENEAKSEKNKARKHSKSKVRAERKKRSKEIKQVMKVAPTYAHETNTIDEIRKVDVIAAAVEVEIRDNSTNRNLYTIEELQKDLKFDPESVEAQKFAAETVSVINEFREAMVAGIEVTSKPSSKLDDYQFEFTGTPTKQNVTEEVYHDLDAFQKQRVAELLSEFSDVLVEDSQVTFGEAKVAPFDIELKEGGEEILKSGHRNPYSVKGELRAKLTENYKDMAESNMGHVVRPGDEIKAVSPGFYVYNSKSMKYRLVADYNRSKLNEATKDYEYPLPSIDDIIEKVGRRKYKSILDCVKGFNQVPLTQRAKAYLVMITPEGLFKFRVMTFGPKNAPKWYQHIMDTILEEGRRKGYVFVYIDDLFVGSDTFDQHLDDLRNVFVMLRTSNMKLGKSKAKLFLKQAKYCGKFISDDGMIRPDPFHLKAIREFPTPKSVKNVQEFLGLCGYVSNYNPNYAHIAAPLSGMTSKKFQFDWTEECNNAFMTLRSEMVRISELMIPDYKKEFKTKTDASKIAASCVISQEDPNKANAWVPVFVASWVFNKAQRSYNPADREALALLWTTRKFRHVYIGRTNDVDVDNSAITGEWDVEDPFGKRARWKDELAQYTIHLHHIPREENQAADALTKNLPDDMLDDVEFIAATEVVGIPPDTEWKAAQNQDKDLKPIITFINDGTLPEDKKLAQRILRESKHYALNANEVLERIDYDKSGNISTRRMVIPLVYKRLILALYHDAKFGGSHLGREKTYRRVASNFFFEHMRKYIAIYVKTCVLCQKIKQPKVKSTSPLGTIQVSRPWEKVSIDGYGPWKMSSMGNTHAHVVLDEATKHVTILAVPDKSAIECAKNLRMFPFRFLGIPTGIHHDLGKEYTNDVIDGLCKLYNVDNSRTTLYHPQGNPSNERIHQFIGSSIVAAIQDDERYWDKFLIEIEMAWNSAIDELGISPSKALLGRQIRVPGDIPPVERQDMNYMGFIDQLQYIQARALTLLMEKKVKTQEQRDKNPIPLTEFKENEEVLMYLPRVMQQGDSYKLHAHWQGPYTIERKGKNPKVYYVLDQFSEPYGAPISVLNLKPFHDRKKMMPEEYTVLPAIKIPREESENEDEVLDNRDVYIPDLDDLEEINNVIPRDKHFEDDIVLPNSRDSRSMIGHEAYVRSDGKIVLKSRRFQRTKDAQK
jgi:RNase H-like domain found in reverse transcriptase/Integrase zinc binding domain/Reverse transcriptase (RNA-dependent DNA polymerase)